jgi:phage tail sheath protein FI
VGDSPARLENTSTAISNFATNAAGSASNDEDGLVTSDSFTAVYYPWGTTSDLAGNDVFVPPSHMVLRTLAVNDDVAFPWFAPAGIRRGVVDNATSVGFIKASTGEKQVIAVSQGIRDTLQSNRINPISFLTGAGLTIYGQKTRHSGTSALDRVNVARLVVFLRSQLDKLAQPFIFEPNDELTRNEIKQAVESLLLEVQGQRGLFDFAVVCDTTNNTPSRIDRNELHVDIAIEPVKSVEFIFIPIRLKNTGEIDKLGL